MLHSANDTTNEETLPINQPLDSSSLNKYFGVNFDIY